MKRWITCMGLALALAAPGRADAEEQREQSRRDWDARGLTRLEVDNPRGDTSLLPSRDGRVHLIALKILRHSERRGAQELSRETRLLANMESGVLEIRVQSPQRREIRIDMWDLVKGVEIPQIDIRLALEVPASMHVVLRSSSGDVQTSQLEGRQDVRSASGDIDISGARGVLSVETRSGDVTLTDVGTASVGTASGDVVVTSARGPLDVDSQSGDVRIDSATDSVLVATASGEVRVGLARGGLDVRTTSGDVTARGGGHVRVRTSSGETKVALMAPLRHAEFSSASGDVTVRVASGIDCDLDADAGSGEVDVRLPLDIRSMKGNHVVGRMGRGNTGIVVRSSSGSVNVTR